MNALEIRDLSKNYGNFNLSHLNLTLPGGCIMGLVGEKGGRFPPVWARRSHTHLF